MTTPIERLSGLVIGTVESVAPHDIRVLIDLDAPHTTALNTGTPSAFPRLNGYVLIPNEAGATVGYISWIGIERSPYPKRSGLKDFGLIDLPFPLRKMAISPLGTLTTSRNRTTGTMDFKLSRGVVAFPSVGDQVLIPSHDQIQAIVGANETDRSVLLGTSPMAGHAPVLVDPDKIFGRHLAVLGNTGSGKSCSVAGLIRWSLEAASKATPLKAPNARFIILDPNGEYAKAFKDLGDKVRIFQPGAKDNPFVLPAWLWNSHEWSAVTNAQPGTQRPILMQALRNLRAGRVAREPVHTKVVRQLRLYRSKVNVFLADAGGASYSGFPGSKNAGTAIQNLSIVMQELVPRFDADAQQQGLQALIGAADALVARRFWTGRNNSSGFNDFNIVDFAPFDALFATALQAFPTIAEENMTGEDLPVPFDISQLADTIDDLSTESSSNANMANFVSFLTLRIRSLLADHSLRDVVAPAEAIALESWLEHYIGADDSSNGQIAIVDLSLVSSNVTHIVIAVLARLIFEALQRYRSNHPDGKSLPTVLVLEEAHNFVRRSRQEEADAGSSSALCREAFEKIAREGRKFGLGLVLSSQRPSELSPTVLAQCNTFLLHRIVNDSDQDLVARLVPDNVGSLLRELPSLPSRQAILLGWATPIPVLVEVTELLPVQRPLSDDPDYWDVWSRKAERAIDWPTLAADWVGEGAPAADD
jgi:uncharacterized protein